MLMPKDTICNNDLMNEKFYKTVNEIANWNINMGAGTIKIHKYAIQKICRELMVHKNNQDDRKV